MSRPGHARTGAGTPAETRSWLHSHAGVGMHTPGFQMWEVKCIWRRSEKFLVASNYDLHVFNVSVRVPLKRDLACVWKFSERFPVALDYYSRNSY